MNDRELIRAALWAFPPSSAAGATIMGLTNALERHLSGKAAPLTDERAVRDAIDESPWHAMLAWSDMLEDRGENAAAEGMRWLARNGKWPGRSGKNYRWMAERPEFGGGASWTLPSDMLERIRAASATPVRPPIWDSVSAALLDAARCVAAPPAPPPARTVVFRCGCPLAPCRCKNPRCCHCGQIKQEVTV